MISQWLGARLRCLQCINKGDTSVLIQAIDLTKQQQDFIDPTDQQWIGQLDT